MSEKDIEEIVAAALMAGHGPAGEKVLSVERQMRVGNSYLDLVATLDSGVRVIVELKRQRVTVAAMNQVIGYQKTLGGGAWAMVIGHGLATDFNVDRAAKNGVAVWVFDDELRFRCLTEMTVKSLSFDVTSQVKSLRQNVPLQLNGTELNGTEENPIGMKDLSLEADARAKRDRWVEKIGRGNRPPSADEVEANLGNLTDLAKAECAGLIPAGVVDQVITDVSQDSLRKRADGSPFIRNWFGYWMDQVKKQLAKRGVTWPLPDPQEASPRPPTSKPLEG